jgi:pantoate--beta-alanine ligase
MREVTRIDEVRSDVDAARGRKERIGFVPTMGALHAGHLSLIAEARRRSDFVVLSIFVNPTQFGPGEDFEAYPRDLEKDRALAVRAGADLLFVPSTREMYPDPPRTSVHVAELSEPMCGRSRPGHFDGVALVVAKLLNVVRPDVAVFGRKDSQQLLLIRRLAVDLNLPGEIVGAPTVREADGLAMSSRNVYLAPDERRAAVALSRGLASAAAAFAAGERSGDRLVAAVRAQLDAEPLVRTEYVEIREREFLGEWTTPDAPAVLAVAARVGRARLIDNVFLPEEAPAEFGKEKAIQ